MRTHQNIYCRLTWRIAVAVVLFLSSAAAHAQFKIHDIEIQVCINERGNARI